MLLAIGDPAGFVLGWKRQMAVLGPIVEALVRPIVKAGSHVRLCRARRSADSASSKTRVAAWPTFFHAAFVKFLRERRHPDRLRVQFKT